MTRANITGKIAKRRHKSNQGDVSCSCFLDYTEHTDFFSPPAMHKLSTFFLYAFTVDGLISAVDILSRHGTSGTLPGFLALGVSLVVLLVGGILFVGMAFTPQLSKRLILPPLLFLGLSLVWAVMLGDREALSLALAETLLGLGLIVGYWDRSAAGSGIQDFTSARPLFTFRNFAFTALLNSTLTVSLVALISLSLAQKVRSEFEKSTGSYLTIRPGGVSLEERTFQRDNTEIRLISMIHIAKSGFYDEVAKALPADTKAVVLLEGISDRQHLINGKFDYSHFAQLIGFASQKESSFTTEANKGVEETRSNQAEGRSLQKLEYRHADIDLEEFSPSTVRWMKAFGSLLECSSIPEALQKYSESKATLEHSSESVYADILDKRNEHLLGEIQKELATHTTIVVPWGAKHMPGLQSKIEEWGFKETQRVQREAIHFQNKKLIGFLALVDRLPSDSK